MSFKRSWPYFVLFLETDSSFRYDAIHHIRRDMVAALKKEFPDWGLT